jgi:hypothetical protein
MSVSAAAVVPIVMLMMLVSGLPPPIILVLPVPVPLPCSPVPVKIIIWYTVVYRIVPIIPWETIERSRYKTRACNYPWSIIAPGPVPPAAPGPVPAASVKDNVHVYVRSIIGICSWNYRQLRGSREGKNRQVYTYAYTNPCL